MQISKWTAEELFNLFVVVEKKFILITFNDMNIYWKVVKSCIFPMGRTSRHCIIKNDFLFTSTFSGVCVFVDCFAGGSDSFGTHDGRRTPARTLLSGDHKCSIGLKAEYLAAYVHTDSMSIRK